MATALRAAWRTVAGLLAVVLVGATFAIGPTAHADPAVVLSDSTVAVGESIIVRGSGWPAGNTLAITTCGNFGANGSADCDQSSQVTAPVGADGTFSTSVVVGRPPANCPCAIRAVSQQENVDALIGIDIAGIPLGDITVQDFTRALTAELDVKGSGPITAYLGGPAKRTFVLSVTNTGSVPLQDPEVTVFAGKGSVPTETIARPQLGTIEPGQTTTYEQGFTIPWTDVGSTTVRALFSDVAPVVEVTAKTSTTPWLLIVLAVLLLQLPLLGLYGRGRSDGGEEDPFVVGSGSSPATGAEPSREVVPVASGAVHHAPARPLVPQYRPVFGVSDLRAYLTPDEPWPASTPAPRVVICGVVPSIRALPAPTTRS